MQREAYHSKNADTLGLKGIKTKKFKVITDSNHSKPVAPDFIEQDFRAPASHQKWISDITYVWTNEGLIYLAVGMGVCSPNVGWSMNRRMPRTWCVTL